MRHFLKQITWLVLAAVLAAGCNSDGSGKNEDDQPEALPLLTEATETLQNASTFEMEIDVSGYPVAINISGIELPEDTALTFQYAKGVFVAPNRLKADIQFSLGALGTTAELIAIDQDQYLQLELLPAGGWMQGALIEGFTPNSLLDENTGIPHALTTITSLELVGEKDLDGIDTYHLRGTVNAGDVNTLTFGLIKTKSGQLAIDVYILTENRLIERIVLNEPPPDDAEDDAEPTIWTITITGYNTPATVEAPDTSS